MSFRRDCERGGVATMPKVQMMMAFDLSKGLSSLYELDILGTISTVCRLSTPSIKRIRINSRSNNSNSSIAYTMAGLMYLCSWRHYWSQQVENPYPATLSLWMVANKITIMNTILCRPSSQEESINATPEPKTQYSYQPYVLYKLKHYKNPRTKSKPARTQIASLQLRNFRPLRGSFWNTMQLS